MSFLVMIAVDGSEQSLSALKWYLDELHHTQNKLVLAHCMKCPDLYAGGATLQAWDKLTIEAENNGKNVKKVCSRILRKRKIKAEYLSALNAEPGEWLVQSAENLQASLLVLGSSGQHSLQRALKGSTGDYVLHHTHCPVAVHPQHT